MILILRMMSNKIEKPFLHLLSSWFSTTNVIYIVCENNFSY